jgi:hypothetical protein
VSHWSKPLLLTLLGAVTTAAPLACKIKIPASQESASGMECETSDTCPYPDGPCLLAMCLDGECVHVPAPEGTLPEDEQKRGDCQQLYCDGQGNISTFPARIDRPVEDGNPCTEAICDVDQPKQAPKQAGARCGDEGLCNGAGRCGVCLPKVERCDGHAVVRCDAEGQWTEPEACTLDKPLCSKARCIGITQVATGRAHSCVSFDDGSLRCWGANHRGQLGGGGLPGAQAPSWAADLAGIVFSPRHACAVKSNTAWCWGAGDFGQLGNGSYHSSAGPVAGTLAAVAEVAVGAHHSCARTTTGEVHCWGRNDRGQLGSGTTPPAPLAEVAISSPGSPHGAVLVVAGLEDATALMVDGDHSCARRRTGGLSCWGLSPFALPAPIERPEPDGAGSAPDPEAVKEFERLEKATATTPTAVTGLKDVSQVACGANHCCARLATGTVHCWGAGKRGQLGQSARQDSFQPVAVEGLAGAAEIALGADFACALLTDGAVSCWGSNAHGQLGTGTETAVGQATAITSLGKTKTLHLGDAFACALATDGRLSCWGAGGLGQLGADGAKAQRVPITIAW